MQNLITDASNQFIRKVSPKRKKTPVNNQPAGGPTADGAGAAQNQIQQQHPGGVNTSEVASALDSILKQTEENQVQHKTEQTDQGGDAING